MSEATCKIVHPDSPNFCIYALVVTSRLDEKLGRNSKNYQYCLIDNEGLVIVDFQVSMQKLLCHCKLSEAIPTTAIASFAQRTMTNVHFVLYPSFNNPKSKI